jgi:hypothetical protein
VHAVMMQYVPDTDNMLRVHTFATCQCAAASQKNSTPDICTAQAQMLCGS